MPSSSHATAAPIKMAIRILLLLLAVLLVSGSPLQQHTVKPATRQVRYRGRHRRRTTRQITTVDPLWKSVHADASIHTIHTAKEGTIDFNDVSWWNSGLQAIRRRILSTEDVEDGGVEDPFLGGETDLDLPIIHDKEQNQTSTSDGSVYTFSGRHNNRLANETTSIVGTDNTAENIEFQPIRIQAFLGEEAGGGEFLNSKQQDFLMLRIIRPALIYWSAALRVEPVRGNLTVDRSQLEPDQRSCGPPDTDSPRVKVPLSHLELGVENADFLLYVNLAFRNGTRLLEEREKNSQENSPQVCSGDYFAASAFCSTDQQDRPVAAILHLCIDDDFFEEEKQESNIMVVLHELGHALGFNAVSLAHFRAPDGSPRTERDPITGAVPLVDVNCTGPVDDPVTLRIPLPSSDILHFRTVRGGLRVAEIVTPLVRQVVRNHFDCQHLPGAELESGEPTSCLGDHWERRLFKTELLNPLIDEVAFNPFFSSLTLAYFADSGWYRVDLSRASSAAGWGRAAGCDFVEKECVQDGEVPTQYESFFCAKPNAGSYGGEIQGCTHDLVSKAFCSLENYDGELPPVFRYFNGSNVGGNDPFMDYCPVYSGFANGLCSDKQNEAVIRVNGLERFGRRNSRCLAGKVGNLVLDSVLPSISDSKLTPPESPQVRLELTSQQAAMCMSIACVVEDQSLRVQVDGIWEVCEEKDQVIIPRSALSYFEEGGFLSSSNVVSVICPDPVRVCPTFYCKRDCLGTNQVCDYDAGECVCPDGGELNDGRCKPTNMTAFFKPEKSKETGLPDPTDPLAAIYVPRARSLRDESRRFWTLRNSLFMTSALAIAGVLVSLCLRFYVSGVRGSLQGSDEGDSPDDTPQETINPEKHKMVAAVVVDLRMNNNTASLPERVDPLRNRDSETDMSMTDTESSVLDQSFGLPTIADLSEHIELPTIRTTIRPHDPDFMDPLAPPNRSPRVRRRGIFSRY